MRLILAIIAILSLPVIGLAQEQLNITTYYPSPYGSYTELQLSPIATGSRSVCNAAAHEGKLYYDLTTHKVEVCDYLAVGGYSWRDLKGGVSFASAGSFVGGAAAVTYNVGNGFKVVLVNGLHNHATVYSDSTCASGFGAVVNPTSNTGATYSGCLDAVYRGSAYPAADAVHNLLFRMNGANVEAYTPAGHTDQYLVTKFN
jgi:hypothetical protein